MAGRGDCMAHNTMALKANPNILECLCSPVVEKVTSLGAELIAVRQGFLSQKQWANVYVVRRKARSDP